MARIEPLMDRQDLLHCDIVMEAVIEDEPAKKQLISSLAEIGYDKLLVSNTSSISITRLASAYAAPEKFMGMHFMNPVPIQPGCELIRGFLTSEVTFQTVLEFCRELGKEPIRAEDKAGFGINRMFIPFLNESVKVIEEGIMSCEDADKTTLCLGHKMGPITTLDYVGLDTTLAIAQVLEKNSALPTNRQTFCPSSSLPDSTALKMAGASTSGITARRSASTPQCNVTCGTEPPRATAPFAMLFDGALSHRGVSLNTGRTACRRCRDHWDCALRHGSA